MTDYAKKTGASAVRTDAGPSDAPAGESKTADEKKPAATDTKAADDQARGGFRVEAGGR